MKLRGGLRPCKTTRLELLYLYFNRRKSFFPTHAKSTSAVGAVIASAVRWSEGRAEETPSRNVTCPQLFTWGRDTADSSANFTRFCSIFAKHQTDAYNFSSHLERLAGVLLVLQKAPSRMELWLQGALRLCGGQSRPEPGSEPRKLERRSRVAVSM